MSKCTPNNRLADALPRPLGDVDSLLSRFFAAPTREAATRVNWAAPASLWEADDKLHVEVDVPGVVSENVAVTVENGQLSIAVERSAGENPPVYACNERRFGKVTRSLELPESVDPESVEATLANGVLHVTVAKRPETQPRKIEVRQN